jgi:Ni/Co efflux regulator RcnB
MAVRLLSRLEARQAPQRLGAVVRGGSRAAFEVAWSEYLPKSTEANFRASRVHEACREKYARFDCGERIPSDWRQHG